MKRKNALVVFVLCLFLVLSISAMCWAAESPSQLVVVRAGDNSLWKATCLGSSCTGFTNFPGMFASTPTVVWDGNLLNYMVWGRAANGSIWKATFTRDGIFSNDWVVVPGNTPTQIGAAGSNLSYPYNNWISSSSVDVSTLSTDCNNMSNLGSTSMYAPSNGYLNLFASGIYAPLLANKWVRVCIATTSGGNACESWSPFLESSSVGPESEGERRFALNGVKSNLIGNTTYPFYLKACRESGATGSLIWNDVIGIFTK